MEGESKERSRKKPLRFHNHPHLERQLKVPDGHVIIDSDVFFAVKNKLGDFIKTEED